MKVNSFNTSNPNFKGIYNSNSLKKILKFANDNSFLFAGTVSLVLSTTARPICIMLTPKTDKENKKCIAAKSLSSTFVGYLLTLALSLPFAKSVKNVDKNPQKFLKKESIEILKDGESDITKSKTYKLATQTFKLGLGLIVAAPKAILTALGTPLMLKMFNQDENNNKNNDKNNKQITFKGKPLDRLSEFIGHILDKKKLQNFAKQYKDSNFPMHTMAATDVLTTATFIHQIDNDKKVKPEHKKTLISNSVIATTLSLLFSYTADSITKKPTEKFIQKFKEANKNAPELDKYISGIKIAKPVMIMGIVYYIFIPMLSTFLADKTK